MNPLNLPGPEFLVLYLCLLVLVGICAFISRESLRNVPPPADWRREKLHPYEVAFLAEGPARAVQAAIIALVHRNVLRLDESQHALFLSEPLSKKAHWLESAIVDAVDPDDGRSVKTLVDSVESDAASLEERPQQLGLVLNEVQARNVLLFPTLLFLAVPLFGAIKVIVGISRERPVGILVFLCIVSAVAAFLIFARRAHRSKAGDLALDSLKEDHAALRSTAQSAPERLDAVDLSLVVALLGLSTMKTGPFAALTKDLTPVPDVASSSGGWIGCGGGGGCGGGCGGGGCGGCGG